jgi:hypothetical protein
MVPNQAWSVSKSLIKSSQSVDTFRVSTQHRVSIIVTAPVQFGNDLNDGIIYWISLKLFPEIPIMPFLFIQWWPELGQLFVGCT